MVDDLLDTSRLITGRLSLELADFVLNDLIQASVDVVRQSTVEKSHRMVVSLPSEPVRVFGDAGRLRQVLWYGDRS
jgi:signal transduction histidine kinase